MKKLFISKEKVDKLIDEIASKLENEGKKMKRTMLLGVNWDKVEEWQRYADENWECKDCCVSLNSDGICPSCGDRLEW